MKSSKTTSRRLESTKSYLDGLNNQYSKLNIVRVDLSYKKPHSEHITIQDANRDFDRMMNNRRSKPTVFKDQIGYVCKREYTDDKGVHFHTIFIYDGQKVQKESYKADQIGEYWQQLTDDKGSFHNCHKNKYKRDGIGIIDHRDIDKRKILNEEVIGYLCKDEQMVEIEKEDKNIRSFTRGIVPKSNKKRGRPRN